MVTHFSVLAQRIPGTGEPGGLLSMGSHRVGHDVATQQQQHGVGRGQSQIPLSQLHISSSRKGGYNAAYLQDDFPFIFFPSCCQRAFVKQTFHYFSGTGDSGRIPRVYLNFMGTSSLSSISIHAFQGVNESCVSGDTIILSLRRQQLEEVDILFH